MSEECTQGIMMVSRHYKNGVWLVNRGCFQLDDKSSQDRLTQDRSSQHKSNQDRLLS